MILVRDVFRLKFGKAREAVAVSKEGMEVWRRAGFSGPVRILTDLVGPSYYTLILESTYDNLAEYERVERTALAANEWKRWYQKFVPLAESGHREIFTIVE
ncbi:MAG TPA: NIPSNAP family protein [Gemmatimonadales bacterium]|nr:NIPSNAP family protein [Gemmatimonadales bacterium]